MAQKSFADITESFALFDAEEFGFGSRDLTLTEMIGLVLKSISALGQDNAKILGMLGNWTVSGNTMTTYKGSETLASYTLTKDSEDNIVSILENTT